MYESGRERTHCSATAIAAPVTALMGTVIACDVDMRMASALLVMKRECGATKKQKKKSGDVAMTNREEKRRKEIKLRDKGQTE